MYRRRAGQHHPRASHTVRGDAGRRQCGVRDGHQRVKAAVRYSLSQPSLPLTVPTEDFGPLEGYAVAVYYSPFSADLTSIFSLDFSRLPTHSSFPRRSRPSDSAAQLARIARASGTTCSISSRNNARSVFFVYRSNPVIIASPELKVTGTVNPDSSRAVPVISLATGRVVEIGARLGDTVKKGQVLLKVQSADISGAFSDYQKARDVRDGDLSRSRKREESGRACHRNPAPA